MKDKFLIWLAWRLPKKLVMWCNVRVMANATVVYSDKQPDEITYSMAAEAWTKKIVK
jgi:hypothetical protein